MSLPVVATIVIILISGVFVFKNLPINQPQPTPDKGFVADYIRKLAIPPSPSPSFQSSYVKKTAQPTPNPSASSSPTPTATTQSSSSSGNSSGSSDNSSNSTESDINSTTTPTAQPSEYPSETFSSDGLSVKAICKGPELNLFVSGKIQAPGNSGSGVWMSIEDNSSGQKMIYQYVGNGTSPTAEVAATIPPTGPIRGSAITLSNDGRSYSSKAYYGPYTNEYPQLNNVLAEVTFSKKCP